MDAEVVSSTELKQALLDRFGLDLPEPAIQGIIGRAARDGLVTRGHGVLRPVRAEVLKYDLESERSSVLRQHEAVVDRLIAFAEGNSDEGWNREDVEQALLAFLEERSLPVLRAIVRGQSYEPELFVDSKAEYLVSAFIANAFERDPEAFSYIEILVKGSMLATALYLPNAGQATKAITDLHIYLDTPFLLRALGWDEAPAVAAAEELMALLKSLGARLTCFTHTTDEVRNVLASCVHNLSQARRGRERPVQMPIVEYCLANGIGPSDVDRRSEKLERDLSRLSISVFDAPDYEIATTVDEKKLEEMLQEYVHYQRDETRTFDMKSLTAINHLRGGRSYRNLEDAKAIFTTPNVRLVLASRKFFREKPDGDLVPVCTVDHELATVAWLRSPVTSPELPAKQILADAYAAMHPDERLWSRYIDEIDRLEADDSLSDEDYHVLRFSVEARRALMRETLGQEDVFTTGTVTEVLRRAHANQQAELMGQLRTTNATLEEVQHSLRDAEAEAEGERLARQQAEEQARELLRSKRASDQLMRSVMADRYAHRLAVGLYWTLAGLVTVALVLTLPEPLPSLLGDAAWIPVAVVWVLLAGLVLLSFLNLAIGVSLRSLSDNFEEWLSGRIRAFLDRNLA
jgi:hypothetical protein